MSFSTIFSGKKLLAAVITAATLSAMPAIAHADQFQYTFTGDAEGSYDGGSPLGNTAFTLTFDEDTSAIVDAGSGYYRYNNTTATLSTPYGPFTLSDVTLVVNSTLGRINFYDSDFGNGLGLGSSSLLGYTLQSNINVPVSSSGLNGTFGVPASDFSLTDSMGHSHTLQFTSDADLGFSATDLTAAPTPEPSSLLLLGTGLSGLAALCRRFVKA